MDVREKILQLVEEIIQGTDLYVVDVKAAGGSRSSKISVLLDSDHGISIDECGKINRKLGEILEEQNLIQTSYTLEVSSPGVDEPLKLVRQYHKNIGRDLSIILQDNSQIKGKLEEVKPESVILTVSDKKSKTTEAKEVSFKDIKKSNVIVSFK